VRPVAADDICPRQAAGRPRNRLRAVASWDERFALAAEILCERLVARRIDPEVAYTCPTSIATSTRSPGSRRRRWPPPRGSSSTTSRGRLHREAPTSPG